MEERYVRVPTGEVGYITCRGFVRSYNGKPSRSQITVRYRALETWHYRTTTFDVEDESIEFVTREEYDEFIRSDEFMAAHKRMRSRKSHPQNEERDKKIYSLRKSGRTYTSIADEYGLTPQRIRDICIKKERDE